MILLSVNSRSYSAQRREFQAPQPLDPSVAQVRIRLTRESWPAGNPLVEMGFEYSVDNGANWAFAGSAAFVGGVFLDRNGQPFLESALTLGPLPGVGTSGRLIRGFVDNAQALTTAITVETLP